MLGLIFGIILPLVGFWATKSMLARATENDDDAQQ